MKAARSHGRMSQMRLAEALQLTKSAVGGWESGRRAPTFVDQLAVSKVTGYPMPGPALERAIARGDVADALHHVTAARWDLAHDDINDLQPELAHQILTTIKLLADEARRNHRLEAEVAVLRARLGRPGRPVGG